MTDKHTIDDSRSDDAEGSDRDLKATVKAYALLVYAYLRAGIGRVLDELGKAVDEIAPQLRGAFSDVSVPARAWKPLGIAVVLLIAAIAIPAAPIGDDTSADVETQEPVEGETYETTDPDTDSETDSEPETPTLNGATLNELPSSFLGDGAPEAPEPPEQVRASAGSQTMNVETSVVDGEPAIVLEDDRTHDGRWVSIETAWFEEQLGEVPNAAYVTHEDGSEYAAALNVRSDSAAFYVREFSTNTVTFDGEVTLSGSEAGDGTEFQYELNTTDVGDPSINLTGVESTQPDSVSARRTDGESLGFRVGGGSSPRDETITLTGIEETASGSLSPGTVSNGYSQSFDIGGNQPARDDTVTLTGREQTATGSVSPGVVSPGYSTTIDIGGNVAPRDDSVTITGQESTTADSLSAGVVSDGYSTTVDVGGNVAPRDESVTITGETTRSSWSGSGTGDGTVTLGGNQPAEDISATIEGSTSMSNGDQSWSWLSDGASRSITGGNIDPTGPANGEPQVTATVNTETGSYTPYDQSYGSAAGILDTGSIPYDGSITVPDTPGKVTHLTVNFDSVSGSAQADVYAVVGEDADDNHAEGTKVLTGITASSGTNTYELEQPVESNGQQITFGFVENENSGSGDWDLAANDGGSGSSENYWVYGSNGFDMYPDVSVSYKAQTDLTVSSGTASASWTLLDDGDTVSDSLGIPASATSVDVSVTSGTVDLTIEKTDRTATEDPALDLNGDGNGEVAHTGILQIGETATISASDGDLTSGSNTIDASSSSGPLPSWTIDATEVTATEDPSVSVGGSTVSHSGVLSDGQTITESVDLSTGSKTVDVSTGGEVGVSASWTEVTGTVDPSVSVSGESVSYSGVLSDGQTITESVDLSTGSQSVDLSGSGPAGVEVTWTEVTATKDPSVEVNGSTVSHSGVLTDGESVTKSVDLTPGSKILDVSTSGEVDLAASWTEVTATEDPTVTVGSSTVSHSGVLGDGQTVNDSVDLSTGSQSASVSVNGPVKVEASWTEITETEEPTVTVNGETVGLDGTLAGGETATLDANASWLQEGTNRVTVSMNSPTSGPASLVTLDYSHGAETTTEATVEETTWSQTTTVANTWASARSNATATVPMNDRVVSVRNVELRENGTTWESVVESDYQLSGTDLTIELGDVAEGSMIEVRATGSKVRVADGEISVLEPTTTSNALDTRIQVDDAGPNFALSVDETVFSDRVHYADNSTWGTATGETTITAQGGQTLALPNATAGTETTVRTWPVEVAPVTGQATVVGLEGDRSEPGLVVRGDGNSDVDYTFVDAADGKPYILWSRTNEIVRDEGLASSPITLTDDNSDETLVFLVDDGSASGSGAGSGPTGSVGGGGAGPMDPGDGSVLGQLRGLVPGGQTLLLGVTLLGGLFVVGRRTGVITEERQEAATSAAGSAAGTVEGLVERVLANEIVFGILLLAGGGWLLTSGVLPEQTTLIVSLSAVPVAMFLVLQQFDRFDFRIWAGSTALVGVLGLYALAPELFETIADEAGIIIVAGVLALAWRALSAWRAEANTPDEVNRIEITGDDGDD